MVSAAVITAPVTATITISAIVIAAATVVTRAVIATVVIGRVIAGIVIRRGVNVVAATVVITAGQPQTEHCSQQHSTQQFCSTHDGLLEDL